MTKVRAKLTVINVDHRDSTHTVRLLPSYTGGEQTGSLYVEGPNAVALKVEAAEIADGFKVGKSVYVDFSPAE